MAFSIDDTITAVASAPGGAVRGIVRVSGPGTVGVLQRCFHSSTGKPLTDVSTAQVVRGTIRPGSELGNIPSDLYLWPTQQSYTRQPSGELHTVGSPPVLRAIVQHLCSEGARLAEPGEFTMRAFLAGRVDLTQAEAVLGIIDAPNQQMLDVALRQLAGGLTDRLMPLRSELIDLLAHVEAGLDFADEEIEFIGAGELQQRLTTIDKRLSSLLDQLVSRQQHADKAFVVLRGQPNAGKSSLLNALIQQDAAIVSDGVGTTRDYVAHEVSWEGRSIVLIDTAGIQPVGADRAVEASAQQLAEQQFHQADLELFCVDAGAPGGVVEQQISSVGDTENRILVLTKIDTVSALGIQAARAILTSSVVRTGLQRLRNEICRMLQEPSTGLSAAIPATALRCRRSLQSAAQTIRQATQLARQELGDELVAAEIRSALESIGQIVGAVYTDDILDRIFGQFCIGK